MPDGQQNPTNVPVVYANNIRLTISFAEFKLFFGEAVPSTLPTTTAREMANVPAAQPIDHVCIAISPDLIPALAAGLQNAIQTYQANFGPLRKPPQHPERQESKP